MSLGADLRTFWPWGLPVRKGHSFFPFCPPWSCHKNVPAQRQLFYPWQFTGIYFSAVSDFRKDFLMLLAFFDPIELAEIELNRAYCSCVFNRLVQRAENKYRQTRLNFFWLVEEMVDCDTLLWASETNGLRRSVIAACYICFLKTIN